MLWLGSWIVFFTFWFYVLRLARLDGYILPLVFVALWCAARFGLPTLGIEGSIYFVSFAALLTAVMIFIDLYRDKMGLRDKAQESFETQVEHD